MTRRIVPVLLLVALVALLAASALVWRDSRSTVDQGAVAVARAEARNFFSLDHRTADEDVDKVLALATGTFKKEYSSRREEIIKGVTDKKLVVTATVPEDAAAVEYSSAGSAIVLVGVDVTTQSDAGADDARYRTRLTLKKVDGAWLVSDVEQVG